MFLDHFIIRTPRTGSTKGAKVGRPKGAAARSRSPRARLRGEMEQMLFGR